MKRSNRLVLLIGIFLAIVAFVLIAILLGGDGEARRRPTVTPVPTTANIVVAAADIDLGATIQSTDVTTKDDRPRGKPADSFTDTSFVVGKIARAKVTTGQYISAAVLNGRRRHRQHRGAGRPRRDRGPGGPDLGRGHDHQARRLRGRHQRLHGPGQRAGRDPEPQPARGHRVPVHQGGGQPLQPRDRQGARPGPPGPRARSSRRRPPRRKASPRPPRARTARPRPSTASSRSSSSRPPPRRPS